MREILFRGKCLNVGNWVYGNYASEAMHYGDEYGSTVYEMWHYIESPYGHLEASGLDRVDPDTVGQYTGLDDKNGVKIFEGDIVRVTDHYFSTPRTFTGTVEYKDGSFVICEPPCTHYRWMDYEVEVIGNKWDGKRRA